MQGGAYLRPLFFDYPFDENCYEDVESTFMAGDSIMVAPLMEKQNETEYKRYFPAGKWISLNNYSKIIES